MRGGGILGGLIEMVIDPSLPPETIVFLDGKVTTLPGGLRPVERFRFGNVTRAANGNTYMLLGNEDERGVAKAMHLGPWGKVGQVVHIFPAKQERVE